MTKTDVTFDFSEASDEVKNALALSHEAIKGHLEALPEPVVTFYKSAAEQLDFEVDLVKEVDKTPKPPKKPKKPGEEEEEEEEESDEEKKKKGEQEAEMKKNIEIVKNALPGVIEAAQNVAVEPLKVEIKKAQDEITILKSKAAHEEMKEVARTLTLNGDEPAKELVDQLIAIRKSMDDGQWTKYLEGQRATVVQLEKSAVFERESSPQAPKPGSAFEELQTIANGIIEKSEDKAPDKAFDIACQQNPKLYERHRREQAARSKAGS